MMKQTKKPEFLYTQGSANVVFCVRTHAAITAPRTQHIRGTSRSTSHIKNYNIIIALPLTSRLFLPPKHAGIPPRLILDVDINYVQSIRTQQPLSNLSVATS